MSGVKIYPEVLSRRKLLKHGLFSGLTVSLAPSLFLGGCGTKEGQEDNTNVIFISIDTLRADHLGCYGYERNTSFNIDSFAQQNILFKNCFIHEPCTAPSHMSMFTGLYPVTHGVNRFSVLDESITTLAEVLKSEGYRTLGFVRQCGQLCPEFGFARGFDVYIEKNHRDFIAELQNKLMAKYLKKNKDEKLFVFIHYYDVHSDFGRLPYDSPPPYDRMYYPDYAGNFSGGNGEIFASEYLVHLNKNKVSLKDDDLRYITSMYDGSVTYTDKYLGELFEILKELELYDKSLIIVTSDHGEEFQEHGWMLHGNPYFYEELVHVPLIIKLPWATTGGKIIENLVESIDFMPTILGTLGIKNVPKMQGENFMRIIESPDAKWKYSVFGYSVAEGPRAFLRNRRWKLVADNIYKENNFKVFDLSNDPAEEFDIMGNPQDVTDELKRELLGRYVKVERHGSLEKVQATPEQLEILKSLGYVE